MRAARALMRRQRGFLNYVGMALGALLVLAIAGRFAYWVATEENFGEVAAVLWIMGFVLAYWTADGDTLVARIPAGFAVFALLSLAGLPLTWLGESRVALLVLLAAQLAFSYHAGRAITSRLAARVSPGEPAPAWLKQDRDIIGGLGIWAMLAGGAILFLVVGPLLVLLLVTAVIDLSQPQIRWLAAAWGFVAITLLGLTGGAARWLILPVSALIYLAVTAGVMAADAVAGPFAEGTGVQVAYTTLPGALLAAAIEVFVFGAPRRDQKKEDSA